MILYPTETLYALGVNALDREELNQLYFLKSRSSTQVASWLVRDLEDIGRYAEMGEVATKIAKKYLPGRLTLVLKVHDHIAEEVVAPDRTIGFRISSDPMAQQIITAFMEEYNAPLTCTSANMSGAPTFSTPGEILQQFGEKAYMINEIHDDGPRKGLASTVVRVIDDNLTVLREGEVSEEEIRTYLGSRK